MEAVAGTNLDGAVERVHGGGSLAYPPGLMLGLLIYAYAQGMFSSRAIERATYQHVGVRYLCANLHPDHDTICKFRRENRGLVKAVFAQVLQLAQAMGLLQVGTVCLDGTKILANAAKRRTLEWKQLEAVQKRVEGQIEELLAQAEAADTAGEADGGSLPQELASRRRLQEKMQEARTRLREMAVERAAERAEDRQKWEANPIGDAPREWRAEPQPQDRINLSDPQSALLPLKGGGYGPAYNVQVATSGEACALIVATGVCTQSNDRQQVLPMSQQIKAAVSVQTLVMDGGYDHPRQIEESERTLEVEIYAPPQAAPERERRAGGRTSQARQRSQSLRAAMRTRVQSARGQELALLRQTTVEPAIGIIKSVLGFRRFSLRGLEKVSTEWELVALAFNCRRIALRWNRN
jgi:transposase